MLGLTREYVHTIEVDGRPFVVRGDRLPIETSILQGRYSLSPDTTRVRRVLDIGAGCGAFAIYAAKRWEGCWVDCYEEDEGLRGMLAENGPAGMRVLASRPAFFAGYDVIRFAVQRIAEEHVNDTASITEDLTRGALVIVDFQTRVP